jgi:IS30 family transposase
MARKCTVCEHQSRHEIDIALVSPGAKLRDIARQYRVSKDSLSRHVNNGHIQEKIQKAQHAHEAVEADKFLDRVLKHQGRFDKLIEKVQKIGDIDWELKVLHGLKEYLELEGKATGAFREKVEHSGNMILRFDKEDANL